jgi:hypothetical protein
VCYNLNYFSIFLELKKNHKNKSTTQRNSEIRITPISNTVAKTTATKKSNSEIVITPLNNRKAKTTATKQSNSEIVITPITKKNNLRSPSVKRTYRQTFE